jgi:hypothetical protein
VRCHEIIHQFDFLLASVQQEDRVILLDYLASGYDKNGKLIQRSDRFIEEIYCIDCPNKRDSCNDCDLVSKPPGVRRI